MVKNYDKPHYIDIKRDDFTDNKMKDRAIKLTKSILKDELFGVLATSGEDECYTSLISFANEDDLKTLAFATPIETKKFEMIQANKNVSILIDNRSSDEKSINDIAAITCLGQARVLKEKEEIEKWSKTLLNKHSYLDEFISADTTAIVLVDISKYYYVTSFQEVIEWSPK